MKERLSRKKLSAPLGILVVVGLVAGILVLSAIIFIVADKLGVRLYYQYIEFALLIVIGILIVRKWLTEYEYDVVDDELIIERYIGTRGKELLRIQLRSIVSIGSDKPEAIRPQRLTYHPQKRGVTYIVYKQNGQERGVFFSPSSALLELIGERRGAKPPQ